jgi:hypothetical protein
MEWNHSVRFFPDKTTHRESQFEVNHLKKRNSFLDYHFSRYQKLISNFSPNYRRLQMMRLLDLQLQFYMDFEAIRTCPINSKVTGINR